MEDVGRMFGFGDPVLAENQEIEHVSYGEKLSNSFCGMCIGFLLFFGGLGVAGWNEYRNVASMKSINEAKDTYKQATCSPIMSELEGELVHVTCPLSNLQVMGESDPALRGIPEAERTGLALESDMEVFQWTEIVRTESKDDKVGGGTTNVKTYTYNRKWSFSTPPAVNTFFKQGESCKTQNGGYACLNWNPQDEFWWGLSGYSLGSRNLQTASGVEAGDYVLPDSKVASLGDSQILTPACGAAVNAIANSNSDTSGTNSSTAAPSSNNSTRRDLQSSTTGSTLLCSPGNATLLGNKMVWTKQDSNGATVDYLTRSYTIRTAETVSVMAEQRGDTFVMWESSYDEDYGLFEVWDGNLTATQMLDQKEAERVGMTWFLRFFTLVATVIGLVMITAPLTEIPDIIPCVGPWIGDLIGYALWVVDCLLGCCCWSVVASLAWIAYRPYVAIPLLCVSCCLCGLGGYAAYTNHKKKHPSAGSGGGKADDDVEVAEEYNPEPGLAEKDPEAETDQAEKEKE